MRILLVEDDTAIAQSLKEGLEDEAYAVDVAHDGDEGYRTATADEYDVIILDVMLPEMNGYEVCRALPRWQSDADFDVDSTRYRAGHCRRLGHGR